MNEETTRKTFERIISGPPYERKAERWSAEHGWPDQYSEYEVQFAWDVLQDFLKETATEGTP